jgi:hypothetical protein
MKFMDLSALIWLKVITDDDKQKWAYTHHRITQEMDQTKVIKSNNVTIFPLGFRDKSADLLDEGDYLALTQKNKLTHIIEVIDKSSYQEGGWYHRFVKVLCWKPNDDWSSLPSGEELLGFKYKIYSGRPYLLENLKETYGKRWENNGGLEAFQQYLSQKLHEYGYVTSNQ